MPNELKNGCVQLFSFLCSRVGLSIIVILYICFGGLIFQALESDIEKTELVNFHEVVMSTDILVEEIWNMTLSNLIFMEDEYFHLLKLKLNKHKTSYLNALYKGYTPYDNIDEFWTISGSILYSTTLVTTIGYGHFTCQTSAGKFVSILYSIIGIPMMGCCLANIGESEANCCRFIYAKLCCCCWKYKKKKKRSRKRNSYSNSEDMSRSKTPSVNLGSKSLVVRSNENISHDDLTIEKLTAINSLEPGRESSEAVQDDETSSDSIDYSKVRVPISLTLFILTTYIMLGGFLFMIIEEWTLLDGVYFSFITLSTIGLGDLVPGNSINEHDAKSELKVIGVFFYLLIGLSLVVMAFNLMQETIVVKTQEFGAFLGIVDMEEDSSSDNSDYIISSMN